MSGLPQKIDSLGREREGIPPQNDPTLPFYSRDECCGVGSDLDV